MRYEYQEACSEVCFILKNLGPGYVERIPQKMMETLEKNRVKHYNVQIDPTVSLLDQNLKEETKAILAVLYRKFLCEEDEREELERDFQEKLAKEKAAKKAIISEQHIETISNNKIETKEIIQEKTPIENIPVAENLPTEIAKKDSFFSKFIKRIKTIFKR